MKYVISIGTSSTDIHSETTRGTFTEAMGFLMCVKTHPVDEDLFAKFWDKANGWITTDMLDDIREFSDVPLQYREGWFNARMEQARLSKVASDICDEEDCTPIMESAPYGDRF